MNTTSTLEIIRQHRVLLERIDDLALRLAQGPWESKRTHLRDDLAEVLRMLAEHFALEASSTFLLTRENLARHRYDELLELDREHPKLLAAFETVLKLLETTETTPRELKETLESAIAKFRRHEAREDEIFSENDPLPSRPSGNGAKHYGSFGR